MTLNVPAPAMARDDTGYRALYLTLVVTSMAAAIAVPPAPEISLASDGATSC
jgi:hypothetical protein